MAIVALLSNSRSTRYAELLPDIRAFIASHANIFHVEISHVGEVRDALTLIARARPDVLVINGGGGTVQAVLTSMMHDRPFVAGIEPPLAILAGRTKFSISADYAVAGKPMQCLKRIAELVSGGRLGESVVKRSASPNIDSPRRRW